MESEIGVTIIIPTFAYDRAIDTVECLENQTYPVEIIVADKPEMNISEARNFGLKRANTEVVGFTDDDCYPHSDWVENAVPHFEKEEVVGVEGHTYGELYRKCQWSYMGCNIFYRRDALMDLQGFDTELAGYREDTDIAWKLIKKGYDIVYEPQAKVCHPDSPGSSFSFENEVLFFSRYPLKYPIWILSRILMGGVMKAISSQQEYRCFSNGPFGYLTREMIIRRVQLIRKLIE